MRRLVSNILALGLTVGLLSACTLDQILIGQVYTIVTPSTGACPALSWQFFVNAQRAINGILSSGQQRIGILSGTLDQNDPFRMTVADADGRPTATASGQFTSDVSTLSIQGAGAGSACDGQTFRLRLGGYFAHQGGGGGGGHG